MKKAIYSLMAVGSLALATSCSMDYEPVGSIIDEKAMVSVEDCANFRNGFYGNLRALSTGAYISYTEIQMDMFIGNITNGNRLGTLNSGDIQSNNTDIEGIWGGLYGGIGSVNFFFKYLPNVEKNLDEREAVAEAENDEATLEAIATDRLNLSRYVAEAHFTRAFFYYWLLDHYCPRYSDKYKDDKYGLPIVTDYFPTASKDYYPDRSTLNETYKFIEDELTDAYNGLKAFEESDSELATEAIAQNSPYLSSWAVRALQARLALIKGDYATAQKYAQEVIDCRKYPLATSKNYKKMWTQDTGTEVIFRPISTSSELGISSTGSAWIGTSQYVADYLNVEEIAGEGPQFLYQTGDIRYSSFIGSRKIRTEYGLINSPVFLKFPGNGSLIPDGSDANMMNMPKVFRTSEMYLIVAEAAAEQNQPTVANNMLETLRKNRISKYSHTDLNGDALIKEVRKERLRELIGEGFRMSDLRRWQQGFTRHVSAYTNYPQATTILVPADNNVTYTDDDPRFVWPIPSAEMKVNPNITNQNPGY